MLQADYTALLTKARSIEAEKSNSISGTSAIVKSATSVESDTDSGIANLSKTMSELITIVKGQQVKESDRQIELITIIQMRAIKGKVQLGLGMEEIKGDQTPMLLDP